MSDTGAYEQKPGTPASYIAGAAALCVVAQAILVISLTGRHMSNQGMANIVVYMLGWFVVLKLILWRQKWSFLTTLLVMLSGSTIWVLGKGADNVLGYEAEVHQYDASKQRVLLVFNKMTSALEEVSGDFTAEVAEGKIKKLIDELMDELRQLQKLPPIPKREMEEVKEKYRPEYASAKDRFWKALDKAQRSAQGKVDFRKLVEDLGQQLDVSK